MADSPVAAYIVEQSNGQFKVSATPTAVAPYGIAIPKDSGARTADARCRQGADTRTAPTQKILDYWQLEDAAISNPQINGAIELATGTMRQ